MIVLLVRWNLGPVLLNSGAPANEKPVTIYKFRTMTDERGEEGTFAELPAPNKIWTPAAEQLLHELLELFNILKGEMSFIGPRPRLSNICPYSERQRLSHGAAGAVGLAQVSGRNVISW